MNWKQVFKRIFGKKEAPAQVEMKYLLEHGLTIGKNFRSYSPYAFDSHWPWLISVGDDVTLSAEVKILAHDTSTKIVKAPYKIGRVTIGNNVYIGMRTLILCNSRIGNNVVIGAGSVVTGCIPDGVVAAGNPARVICSIEEYRKKCEQNCSTHPTFYQHLWNEWPQASPAEWEEMKRELQDTFGYVRYSDLKDI